MTSMPLAVEALAVKSSIAAGGRDETIRRLISAMSRELAHDEAEERRWQLEWDRRSVED